MHLMAATRQGCGANTLLCAYRERLDHGAVQCSRRRSKPICHTMPHIYCLHTPPQSFCHFYITYYTPYHIRDTENSLPVLWGEGNKEEGSRHVRYRCSFLTHVFSDFCWVSDCLKLWIWNHRCGLYRGSHAIKKARTTDVDSMGFMCSKESRGTCQDFQDG